MKTPHPTLAAKAPVPVDARSNVRTWNRRWLDLAVGSATLVLSLFVGEQAKVWLHVPIPGNVLGLFILLLCFRLGLISPRLIEEASSRLLFVLPALFIPIYVSAIGQGQLWSQLGWVLLPALLVATVWLWIFVGHLAQRLLRCNNPVQNG